VLLSLFFVIVLILAVIELGAAIFAVTNKDDFHDKIKQALQEGWDKDFPNGEKNIKPIQDAFKCCGVPGRDAELATLGPLFCTKEQRVNGNCLDVIWSTVESAGTVAIVIAFVVLIVELLAMIFSCLLCRAFRDRRGYYA